MKKLHGHASLRSTTNEAKGSFLTSKNLLLELSEGNGRGINSAWFLFFFVCSVTKRSSTTAHAYSVCGRSTLKLVERFGNRSVRELYERSIYGRSFTSEPRNIKRNLPYQTSYLILCLHVNTTVYLDVIENPVGQEFHIASYIH